MEILRQKSGAALVIKLTGRLDANWCGPVQNALAEAVRDGEHRLQLDMAGVGYVSSAGLRVLLSAYKQLKAIDGSFGIVRASEAVRSVLELAGLGLLLAAAEGAAEAAEEKGSPHASASARFEVFGLEGGDRTTPGMRISAVGDPAAVWQSADPSAAPGTKFGANVFALGLGALGASYADCAPRFGEFLAAAGVAAFQPSDGSSQPDFLVSQDALVPEGRLLSGLSAEGTFSRLARFEATPEARKIGLAELAQTALELGGGDAAVLVAVTETSGLVGASLRRSPAAGGPPGDPFAFPGIRDWLSFTSERAFRDSTSLLVGVVARPGGRLDPLLRPLGPAPGIVGHVHAAAFPYRPLRQGRIELAAAVQGLFDGPALQAVLHLLADPRELSGAGQSEFFRGALWIAPASP